MCSILTRYIRSRSDALYILVALFDFRAWLLSNKEDATIRDLEKKDSGLGLQDVCILYLQLQHIIHLGHFFFTRSLL